MKNEDLFQNIIKFLEENSLSVSKINIEKAIGELGIQADSLQVEKIVKNMIGFGVLTDLLKDETVSEIMVNGPSNIFVERSGMIVKSEEVFESDSELMSVISRMIASCGRRIDASSPMADGRLEDGSRINAIIPPLAKNGATLTIRKFSKHSRSIDDLVRLNSVDAATAEVLKQAVMNKRNIIISGGTGSGKTTLLNALSKQIPSNERLIVIEDSSELMIDHPNLVTLEARQQNLEGKGEVTIRMLVKNALRMRPDRIIVGEVRGSEAMDMLTAMNTGHEGSLTTLHANSPLEALLRLETMCMMSDLGLPLDAIRSQIMQSLDVIIQIKRDSNGRRSISEVCALEKNSNKYELTSLIS